MRRFSTAFVALAISILATAWAGADAPTFYQDVLGGTVTHGDTFQFMAVMNGTPPFNFTWKRGTQVITAGTHTFYGFTGGIGFLDVVGSAATAGSYTVTVSNSQGTIGSLPVTLVVQKNPPHVDASPDPVDVVADAAETTTLTVSASGFKPLVYQWQKNGRNYGAATSSYSETHSINIPSVAANSGDYRCVITNTDGTAVSAAAPVHFWAKTGVVQDVKHRVARIGDEVQFTVHVYSADASMTFQWQHNGVNIYGANTGSLTFTPGAVADAGDYRLMAQTETGTYYSDVANLSVVGDALMGAGALGKTTVLSVPVLGKNLAYAWYASGIPISPSKHYSGLATPTLSILGTTQTDAGPTYRCKVWRIDQPDDQVFSNDITLTLESLPPVFDPVTLDDAFVAEDYTAQLSASGSVVRYLAKGLPAGIVCDPVTGRISGSTRTVGVYHVTVSATNPVGTTTAGPFTMNVTATVDLAATYTGPLRVDGIKELFGTMTIAITKVGTFSGKLFVTHNLGALRALPFTGSISGSGSEFTGLSTPILLTGSSLGSFAGLHQVLVNWYDNQGYTISLVPVGGPSFASMELYTNGWNAKTHPATDYAGYYTTELRQDATAASNHPEASGSGFGTFTVKTDGTLAFVGRLPDGTAFASPAFLDSTGTAWVQAWLYGYKGSIEGTITVTPGDEAFKGFGNIVSGNLFAVRPASTVVLMDFATISNAYFNGFDMPYTVVGSRYVGPSNSVMGSTAYMMNASSYTYELSGGTPNINLSFDIEEFTDPYPASAYLRTNHTAFFYPYSPIERLKFGALAFNAATGLFSGSFTQYLYNTEGTVVVGSRAITYQGVVTRTTFGLDSIYGAGYYVRSFVDVQTDPENAKRISRVALITSRRMTISLP